MAKLGTMLTPQDEMIEAFEKFLCKLYAPSTTLDIVKKLRWLYFSDVRQQNLKVFLQLRAYFMQGSSLSSQSDNGMEQCCCGQSLDTVS